MSVSFPGNFSYPASVSTTLGSSATLAASSSATGASLGGIRGLMNQNNEMRVRFIQNGWLA